MTDIKVMQFGVNDLCGLKGGIITPSLLLVPAAEKKKPLWVFLLELAQAEQRGSQQDAAGSTGLTQPRGCARGGNKKRRQEECPAGGQHCSSTPSEEHSLSPQRVGFLFVSKDALTPGCTHIPPALQASPFPLGNSITCSCFSFPFLSPVQKSSLSIRPVQKQHSCS